MEKVTYTHHPTHWTRTFWFVHFNGFYHSLYYTPPKLDNPHCRVILRVADFNPYHGTVAAPNKLYRMIVGLEIIFIQTNLLFDRNCTHASLKSTELYVNVFSYGRKWLWQLMTFEEHKSEQKAARIVAVVESPGFIYRRYIKLQKSPVSCYVVQYNGRWETTIAPLGLNADIRHSLEMGKVLEYTF